MKASELMTGDWFMFDTEHYEPYERVREYSQVEHFNYGVVYGNSGCIAFCEEAQTYNERKYEKVMPIPLTEEILKANGFIDENATNGLNFRWYVLQTNQEYGDVWGRTNHKIIVAWRKCNSDVYIERPYGTSTQQKISVADIRYVHELQHALRLCGLKELADNLKITDYTSK